MSSPLARRSFTLTLVVCWLGSACVVTGPAGEAGPPGAAGATGAPGAAGSSFLTGSGAPAADLGKPGDAYLDVVTGDVYLRGESGWEVVGSLKGPAGNDGATGATGTTGATGATGSAGDAGADGASFLTGQGAPALGLGRVGDAYLDANTGELYVKDATGWVRAGSLRGADGDAGAPGASFLTGQGAPGAGLGRVGDAYLDANTGDLYRKDGTGWQLLGSLRGPQGATGDAGAPGSSFLTGAGAPGAGLGRLADVYLDTTSGGLYRKDTGGWVLVGSWRPTVVTPDVANATEAGGLDNAVPGSPAVGELLLNDQGLLLSVVAACAGSTCGAEVAVDAGTTSTSGGARVTGAHGVLTLGANGTFRYVPSETEAGVRALSLGESLEDRFTAMVADFSGTRFPSALVVTVHGAEDAPVLTAFTGPVATARQGQIATITRAALLAASDAFDDGPTLDFVVTSASNGALRLGTSLATALPWAAGTNDVIDATHSAYWSSVASLGNQPALTLRARDDQGTLSAVGVTAQVTLQAMWASSQFSTPCSYGSWAVADFDGDLLPDLASYEGANSIVVKRQFPVGTFLPVQALVTTNDIYGLATGRLTNDAYPDLVSAGPNGLSTSPNAVFANTAGGALGPQTTTFTSNAVAFYGERVLTGRLNGDALDDVVWLTRTSIVVGLRNGTGGFVSMTTLARSGGGSIYSGALADLDGDGDLDVVAPATAGAGSDGFFDLFMNDGAGAFTRSQLSKAANAPFSTSLLNPIGAHAADVTGDGHADLVFFNRSGDATEGLWLGRWTAPMTYAWQQLPSALLNGSLVLSLVLVDVDGDQDLDVLASHQAGVLLLLNQGSAGWSAVPALAGGLSYDARLLDMNGDTLLDLVASFGAQVVIKYAY